MLGDPDATEFIIRTYGLWVMATELYGRQN